jgi:hypothetical protein
MTKTTSSTQDSPVGLTLMRYDIKITMCAGRLEFTRGDGGLAVSAESLHDVLADWLDGVRATRSVSGEAEMPGVRSGLDKSPKA